MCAWSNDIHDPERSIAFRAKAAKLRFLYQYFLKDQVSCFKNRWMEPFVVVLSDHLVVCSGLDKGLFSLFFDQINFRHHPLSVVLFVVVLNPMT